MVRALVTAIMRRTHKYYPGGNVGVFSFNGRDYRTKSELRPAVVAFCEGLTYEQVPTVQKNLGLV